MEWMEIRNVSRLKASLSHLPMYHVAYWGLFVKLNLYKSHGFAARGGSMSIVATGSQCLPCFGYFSHKRI